MAPVVIAGGDYFGNVQTGEASEIIVRAKEAVES
jgi:hypothetical protein